MLVGFRRLSGFASRTWMVIHWAFITFLSVTAVVAIFLNAFGSNPPVNMNLRTIAGLGFKPKFLALSKVVIGLNVCHILSDILLLIVPVTMLWRSKIRWTARLRVCLIGLVGLANCGLAAGRAVTQHNIKTLDFTCM